MSSISVSVVAVSSKCLAKSSGGLKKAADTFIFITEHKHLFSKEKQNVNLKAIKGQRNGRNDEHHIHVAPSEMRHVI